MRKGGKGEREDKLLLNLLNVRLGIPFTAIKNLILKRFCFSTFTASASISRFTNTVIGVPYRVRNAGAILTAGTLAWL